MHDKIRELAAWCKDTKQLHVVVRFYPDNEVDQQWCVRVCPNGRGMSAPICTRHGDDLEALAAEALQLSKPRFEQQKSSIISLNNKIARHRNRQMQNDYREIEAMHRTASDY